MNRPSTVAKIGGGRRLQNISREGFMRTSTNSTTNRAAPLITPKPQTSGGATKGSTRWRQKDNNRSRQYNSLVMDSNKNNHTFDQRTPPEQLELPQNPLIMLDEEYDVNEQHRATSTAIIKA